MKIINYILTIILIICYIDCCYCQEESKIEQSKFKLVWLIFEDELEPYLHQFASNKIRVSNDNEKEMLKLTQARYEMYKADLKFTETKIESLVNKNPNELNDIKVIKKLIETEVDFKFRGLPKEFWLKIDKKIVEIK